VSVSLLPRKKSFNGTMPAAVNNSELSCGINDAEDKIL
jgi:hypothetical protein